MVKTTEQVQFASGDEFREWLSENCLKVQGIWLVFGKKGGPITLSAAEALEEALCFGWIDGQMKSIDDTVYIKYFAQRRKGSRWSEKNKGLIGALEKQGKMTEYGRAKVEEAKRNGTWDASPAQPFDENDEESFLQKLRDHELAYTNYMAMSPSVRGTYTAHYCAAKSDETRARRLAKIVERLNSNLKPM